jgi:hypothetical protein
MKWLAVITLFLFCSGYWICDLFYQNGSTAWWDMRLAIITVIICLVFITGFTLTKGFTRAIFLVGIVFCAGDILDRYVFDIQTFSLNDLLLYLFAFYYLRKQHARETKADS